jgi:riboflavin synthase alpha subunit
MEFQVSLIRNTRERISIQHIKSLDIVAHEVNRIMPAALE